MRITKIDRKQNLIELIPETPEDLLHLERFIEEHDIVAGIASRKEKSEESKAVRKTFFAELEVLSKQYEPTKQVLRVTGKILHASIETALHASQSLAIELNKKVRIKKQKLYEWQIERIKSSAKKLAIAFILLDDENALIGMLSESNYKILYEIHSPKQSKEFASEEWKKQYYTNIMKALENLQAEAFIVAGPGFWKDELVELLEEKKAKVLKCSASSATRSAIKELLKSTLLKKLASDARLILEHELLEELLKEIARDGLVAYASDAELAVLSGAASKLLVSENFLAENREKAIQLIELAEQSKAKVYIFGSEASKQLDALGGIACFLRFRIQR